MATGLVLEGGAMRGMFTCGVLDVLMENGMRFDAAVGVSAGAVFGCNLKSHQIGRAIRYNKAYGRDPRYMSLRSLFKTGDLYGADFCYRQLPDELDPFDRTAFAADPMAFYIVATDVDSGRAVYHRCRDGEAEDLLWMRASASMPMVSRVVPVEGHRLLDGGIADPIPWAFLREKGFDRCVIVLTQPEGYRKGKSRALPLMRLALRKTPALLRDMENRHRVYNAQLQAVAEGEKKGRALVLRPPEPLRIRRTETDPGQLERVYQIGRAEAKRQLEAIRRFLQADGEPIA